MVIMMMLLLKTRSDKMSFIMLKGTIRVGVYLINPLTSDGTNMERKRNTMSQVPVPGNLLSHHKLPFMMNNNIIIRS
jgi:hypothetical protein